MISMTPPLPGSSRLKALVRVFALCAFFTATGAGASRIPDYTSTVQRIEIQPASVSLFGAGSTQQVIVTGYDSDGTERDLTGECRFVTKPLSIATVGSGGFITAERLGPFTLAARFGGLTASVHGSVLSDKGDKGVSFVKDIVPVLIMRGCNGGNCHGSMHGKSGFKLSQFGYDPQLDYLAMTRNAGGRRVNLLEPARSLILLKPTNAISHGGGSRFEVGSQEYNTLLDWISQGAPGPKHSPSISVARLEVLPGRRLLSRPGLKQQLVVVAHYEDGTTADVTKKVKYVPQGDGVLTVGDGGLVEAMSGGEATVLVRGTGALGVARIEVLSGPPIANFPRIASENFIDTAVFAKLKRLSILPSDRCTDEVFLRRAYLDAIGTLPGSEEVRNFLADQDPAKRAKLIDRILDRPEYADFWGMIWADLFTITAFKTPGQNTFDVDNWLRSQIRQNVPMNKMVRELVAANGSLHDDPGLGLLLAMPPEAAAAYFSQLFLGVRIQCAHCHNHPFEKWTRNDFYGMAAFFPQVTSRPSRLGTLVYDDTRKEIENPLTHTPARPTFLGAAVWRPDPDESRREALADWITSPKNPYFARAIANRVWRHFMGVGLVEPVDDFRETNPPTNPELLDALAQEFAKGDYDLKHLMKVIMNSRAYQLASATNLANQADHKDYSHYYLRRIYAEPLLDAISQITAEPHTFKFGYWGMKAVEVRDPVIPDFFLQTFQRNTRQMTCEREENLTLVQSMDFISGSAINDSISRPGGTITQLTAAGLSDQKIVEELFLRSLSRFPSSEENGVSLRAVKSSPSRQGGLQDVLWALLNSKEFIFNH